MTSSTPLPAPSATRAFPFPAQEPAMRAVDAGRVGAALVARSGARCIAVGQDGAPASLPRMQALVAGIVAAGADVLDLGLCGTEEVAHAVHWFGAEGGVSVTETDDPRDLAGLRLFDDAAAPIRRGEGLAEVLAQPVASPAPEPGRLRPAKAARAAFVGNLLSLVDVAGLRPLKILVNAGNGAAGPTFDALAAALARRHAPLSFICLDHEPGAGPPDPAGQARNAMMSCAVIASGADMGVAWDRDFDRCFLFDHKGRPVPCEYVAGLLAEVFLAREPGARIVHNPRVIWNLQDVIHRAGGQAVAARAGLSLARALQTSGAIYGEDGTAHHCFRDLAQTSSGMLPWLMVAALMGRRGQSLADLVRDRRAAFPSSGEIAFRLGDPAAAIAHVGEALRPETLARDDSFGLALDLRDWRVTLRASEHAPLLRLNIEARGDKALVEAGIARLTALINEAGRPL